MRAAVRYQLQNEADVLLIVQKKTLFMILSTEIVHQLLTTFQPRCLLAAVGFCQHIAVNDSLSTMFKIVFMMMFQHTVLSLMSTIVLQFR